MLSGGNPGAYQTGTHIYTNTRLRAGHLYLTHEYDPATRGAIESVDWSLSAVVLEAPQEKDGVTFGGVLCQDGQYYLQYGGLGTPSKSEGWQDLSRTLYASDFGLVTSPSTVDWAQIPDFSSTGAPITFGYSTSNYTTGGLHEITWGADNWQVVVHQGAPVLEPSSFVCLSGLLGVGSILMLTSRRRKGV